MCISKVGMNTLVGWVLSGLLGAHRPSGPPLAGSLVLHIRGECNAVEGTSMALWPVKCVAVGTSEKMFSLWGGKRSPENCNFQTHCCEKKYAQKTVVKNINLCLVRRWVLKIRFAVSLPFANFVSLKKSISPRFNHNCSGPVYCTWFAVNTLDRRSELILWNLFISRGVNKTQDNRTIFFPPWVICGKSGILICLYFGVSFAHFEFLDNSLCFCSESVILNKGPWICFHGGSLFTGTENFD